MTAPPLSTTMVMMAFPSAAPLPVTELERQLIQGSNAAGAGTGTSNLAGGTIASAKRLEAEAGTSASDRRLEAELHKNLAAEAGTSASARRLEAELYSNLAADAGTSASARRLEAELYSNL